METIHQILERACRATLSINNRKAGCQGSGVVVAPGLAVTNRHVVAGDWFDLAASVEVSSEEEYFTAPVLKACRTLDLAFLRVPARLPGLSGAGEEEPLLGEDVYAIGFPDGMSERTVTRGVVSKREARLDENRYLQFDAPIYQGNSGGPVINRGGKILGLVAKGYTGSREPSSSCLNLALPWRMIEKKLRDFCAGGLLESSRMCLTCGWPNRSGNHCGKCGTRLGDPAKVSARNKAGFHDNCPVCGREREGDRKYCNGCGASLRREE